MNKNDEDLLISLIRKKDLESGKVKKINGQWLVTGKRSTVPAPIISLPHWIEGSKKVVIDYHA